jgi:ubiquinone/menaquinone biosynthesis C-methylase UbiE
MPENISSLHQYALQRSPAETRRLQAQAQMLNPFTRRMFEQAGIVPGMKVLDIGSGAGDVALLLAEMVGPHGTVVGVEMDPVVLNTARQRAEEAGMTNITFLTENISSLQLETEFDALVGRLILVYLRSPASILSNLCNHVRPGGIVAFQEFDIEHFITHPVHPPNQLIQQVFGWMGESYRRVGIPLRMGLSLSHIFINASLPVPQIYGEATLISGNGWAGYDWSAESIRSLLPLLVKLGLATEEEVEVDTLAERMRNEAISQHLMIRGPDVISAWVQKPEHAHAR